jgi:hypothetical protein
MKAAMQKGKMLLFLELNEVNFEYLEGYIARGFLPNFKTFLGQYGYAETTSEKHYEQLEPWIQWVTAHTGLTLAEHGIFRLGDITGSDIEQIWEKLAARGLSVGAISPMNAKCRLDSADFFVPDPWTSTDLVADPVVKRLYGAIAQAVNDNAQSRVTSQSLLNLAVGGLLSAAPSNYGQYLQYVAKAKSHPWKRAIFLDQLLADLFVKSVRTHQTNFATLFLNAAAHIQHHYLFSSAVYDGAMRNPDWYVDPAQDPLLDVYTAYDRILGRIRTRFPSARIMLATGLHQDPHPNVTYYWRIRDHAAFLKKIDVQYKSVEPRMSRDFLLTCETVEAAVAAEVRLNAAYADDGSRLFEVDNRGNDLFVMLIYPSDINKTTCFSINDQKFMQFVDDVAFVAIKNGEHNGIGYFSDSNAPNRLAGTRFPLVEMPARIFDAFGLQLNTTDTLIAA